MYLVLSHTQSLSLYLSPPSFAIMADSSALLNAAKNAQKKKVMKQPDIDLDMDALMAGVLGEGDGKKDKTEKKKVEQEDEGEGECNAFCAAITLTAFLVPPKG